MPSDPEKLRTQWSNIARKCCSVFAEIVILRKKGPASRQCVVLFESLWEETCHLLLASVLLQPTLLIQRFIYKLLRYAALRSEH